MYWACLVMCSFRNRLLVGACSQCTAEMINLVGMVLIIVSVVMLLNCGLPDVRGPMTNSQAMPVLSDDANCSGTAAHMLSGRG
jgi:hypothetical protein